jgi:predicted regulator of Ras-like GTPase activity (Roadblock/LC7/MglB family)
MASLLDPTNSDNLGIMSLLGPALSSGVTTGAPSDTGANTAAFLAAANAMANAGAPTLGPPPTTAQAILGALGAGRGAAQQQEILPFIAHRAAMQDALSQIDLETKLFNYDRMKQFQSQMTGPTGVSAATPTPAAPAAPTDIASLPEVQQLPEQTRAPAIAAMISAGMSPTEAAQYARMLMTESGGLHIDPKTGQVMTSTAGAQGVAQVMPDTFTDMAALHHISGANTDLVPNLTAGANYFHDQVVANGGDLRNGVIAYSMGPRGLQEVLNGKRVLPAETLDYLAKTGAPLPPSTAAAPPVAPPVAPPSTAPLTPALKAAVGPQADPLVADPVTGEMIPRSTYLNRQALVTGAPSALPQGTQFAGPGAGPSPPSVAPVVPVAAPVPPAGGTAADPLDTDPITHQQVPRSIIAGARAAYYGAPENGPKAYTDFINDYLQKRALAPHFVPAGPGMQTNVTNQETSAAPGGTVTLSAPTPEQRKALFPNVPSWQDILLKKDQTGAVVGYELPSMGEEPMKPISDQQAQLPGEQGGAGASYRPGTSYAVGTRSGLVKPIQIERGAGPSPATDASGQPIQTPAQLAVQGQQFEQAHTLQRDIETSGLYDQWQRGDQRFNGVFASLNQGTRAGDEAALLSLAKIFDPSAVVNEGRLEVASTYGGIGQQLQNAWGKLAGSSGLPDDVRQQIGNLAIAEQGTRDSGVIGQIARTRATAQALGVPPQRVMPLFNATALTKDAPEAQNAPAGVTFAQPWAFQGGKWVHPQQTDAPAQPPASGTVPAPGAGILTPKGLQAMDGPGFGNVLQDYLDHPARYNPADQTAIQAEIKRRGLSSR